MSSPSFPQLEDGPVHKVVPESFGWFFESWLHEQGRDLEELKAAAKSAHAAESTCELTQSSLRELVDRLISHYDSYYLVKSESAKVDVLGMLAPSWRSTLEEAFLWVGGWRPTTAFHLLYSVSGSQFEEEFSELLTGLRTGDLGDLSLSQLGQVSELQQKTVREERELTESMAAVQETVADASMVKLSHIATELERERNDSVSSGRVGSDQAVEELVESILGTKEEKLREILRKADDLRMRTVKNVVQILNPLQAVHFLIAAAQLHLRVHEWGKNKQR